MQLKCINQPLGQIKNMPEKIRTNKMAATITI